MLYELEKYSFKGKMKISESLAFEQVIKNQTDNALNWFFIEIDKKKCGFSYRVINSGNLNQSKSSEVYLHIFAHEFVNDLIEIGESYNVYRGSKNVGLIKITKKLERHNMDTSTTNQQLIHTFYTAFSKKDYATMQSCYAETVVFNDAVFKNLNSAEVKAMWEMLCKRGKDLQLEFSNIEATENSATANWKATYTFSATGKRVVNNINAQFEIENGKIVKHTDSFNFYTWAKQAFGIIGILLGWTPFFKNKVQKRAMESLRVFMTK